MTKGGLRIISAAGWGKRKIGRSEEERGKRERGGGGGIWRRRREEGRESVHVGQPCWMYQVSPTHKCSLYVFLNACTVVPTGIRPLSKRLSSPL